MNYPLKLRFKFFALAPQIYVQDATDAEVCDPLSKMRVVLSLLMFVLLERTRG